MKIGITGSNGLLGWHLRCFLKTIPGISILHADRSTFDHPDQLEEFVRNSDAIVHLAGMNRGDEQEVANTNVDLTRKLIQACEANYKNTQKKPHLVFSSSTHIYRDTPYGQSKRVSTDLFQTWSNQAGSGFTNIVFPHLFGEGGKPFYNSAVSTFCYQLALGEQPTLVQDSELELLHAGKSASIIYDVIAKQNFGELKPTGNKIKVSEVLNKIKKFDVQYKNKVFPILNSTEDKFDLQLFNTYRHYLYPQYYPVAIPLHSDSRGNLFEVVKDYNETQVFLSTTLPGIVRGNHFHLEKIERFCVIQGQAKIQIRKLFSDEVQDFHVKGDQPCYIDIPTLHTHNIQNTGDTQLFTLFWSNEIFNPEKPDTFTEKV